MEEEPHRSSQSRRLVRRECGPFAVHSNSECMRVRKPNTLFNIIYIMRIALPFYAQVGSDHSRPPTKPNLWATLPSTRKLITIRTSLSAKVVILRRAISSHATQHR
ncbi:hypothetical protein PSEUDO9AG_40168 [Pseudomonas sp. 9Ag]|nr:hypothetical protein PSEUDO9AG_40168 [Pseudomonas sp. 9Ag]